MKRIGLFLLLFILFPLFSVQAEGAAFSCDVPADVKTFFSQEKFSGTDILAFVIADNESGADYAFAVGSKNGQNTLYGFEKKDDHYTYWLVGRTALPQGKGTFTLWTEDEWIYYSASEGHSRYVKGPVVCLEFRDDKQQTQTNCIYANEGTSSIWRLKYIHRTSENEKIPAFSVLTYEDHLHYLSANGRSLGKVKGVVQTNLRYLNYAGIPPTPEEAQMKFSTAPSIPWESELIGQEIAFSGGQKLPVYSGPGTQYPRAGNGKAIVSTNDWIQVFGTENGYALIQYALSAEQMRFGYIDASALPQGHSVNALVLDHAPAHILTDCSITDDPLKSGKAIAKLQSGEQVTWLAKMGPYAYVETQGASPQRGFVDAQAVAMEFRTEQLEGTFSNDRYTATIWLTLQGSDTRADILLQAEKPEYLPTAYAALCNQTATVPADVLSQPYIYGDACHVSFSMIIPEVNENTRILSLCPYKDGQYLLDECISFILPSNTK